jgi:hypothetical protein
MANVLLGPDGQEVDVDAAEQEFHAALATPEPDEKPDYPAPPRRDYGVKDDGTPKLAAGRPRKTAADRPRAGKVPDPPPAKPKNAGKDLPPGDYTEKLTSFGNGIWMGLAALPLDHARAFGAVWKIQLPAQVAAWNVAAQQDAGVRRAVEKLAGGPTWIIGVAIATAPLVGAGIAIVQDPAVRAELAGQTTAEFAAFLKSASPQDDQTEFAEPESERAAA